MLEKEAVDRFVRRPFDLSVQVLLVPVLRRQCIEIVVVSREAVPDICPDAESGPLVDGDLAGPTNSAATHDGGVRSGLPGNLPFESLVGRSEGQEARDGLFQLVSVAFLLTLAGLSSESTLGRPSGGGLLGTHPSLRNCLARRPKSEEPTVLAMSASRLPRQPIGTCGFDGPGHEGIARWQVLPAGRDLDVAMLRIPLTILGRVDVEMLPVESLRIDRGLRLVHI